VLKLFYRNSRVYFVRRNNIRNFSFAHPYTKYSFPRSEYAYIRKSNATFVVIIEHVRVYIGIIVSPKYSGGIKKIVLDGVRNHFEKYILQSRIVNETTGLYIRTARSVLWIGDGLRFVLINHRLKSDWRKLVCDREANWKKTDFKNAQ